MSVVDLDAGAFMLTRSCGRSSVDLFAVMSDPTPFACCMVPGSLVSPPMSSVLVLYCGRQDELSYDTQNDLPSQQSHLFANNGWTVQDHGAYMLNSDRRPKCTAESRITTTFGCGLSVSEI